MAWEKTNVAMHEQFGFCRGRQSCCRGRHPKPSRPVIIGEGREERGERREESKQLWRMEITAVGIALGRRVGGCRGCKRTLYA